MFSTAAMSMHLDAKLQRIRWCAATSPNDTRGRNLLHAYIACLSVEELCVAILATLGEDKDLRLALRSRLLRLAKEDEETSRFALSNLAREAMAASKADKQLQVRVDAFLSAIYPLLPVPERMEVLTAWADRGTRGADRRWLKAIAADITLFDADKILSYWQASGDEKAAKIVAYQCAPALLNKVLPELVQHCGQGWIVSRAVMRATEVSEAVWSQLRSERPGTYAYLMRTPRTRSYRR